MSDFFKNFFSSKSENKHVEDSLNDLSGFETRKIQDSLTKTKYQVSSCQSAGRERNHNEDTLFTFSSTLDGIDSILSFGVYLVADGMGGHQSGEIASNLAARAISSYLVDQVYLDFIFNEKSFSDEELQKILKDAVNEAQMLIKRRVPGGGTTLTLIIVLDERIFSAHIGDSRIYTIGIDGKMTLRTKDHSLVKRLVDLGEISEDEASIHPQRNVLYRALGQVEDVDVDLGQLTLSVGEQILLCSDGLWGVLSDQKMEELLQKAATLNEATCRLVQAANEAGGPDNISVILLERVA